MTDRPITRALAISLAVATLHLLTPRVPAAIVTTGAVDPTMLGESIHFVVRIGFGGENSVGTLTIDAGSVLMSRFGYIGYLEGSMGTATVSGTGSMWNNSSNLAIGFGGASGELNIIDGGSVNVLSETHVAERLNSDGAINFDQGTLATGSLFADFNRLKGIGTINTHGLIADGIDLVFDATRGPQQTIILNDQPGQNITVNLDQTEVGTLGAGYNGGGSLTIRDGVVINSYDGNLGYKPGSSGTATVSGRGSTWNHQRSLHVGQGGEGTLIISDGGVVNVMRETYVGSYVGGTGAIYFDNGTLNTGSLFADFRQISGTGTINTHGLVADGVDLLFDADHGLQQTFILNEQPGQNITVNLDQTDAYFLGAGYRASGSLTIRDGVVIDSSVGRLGFHSGSSGTATVSGPGSAWNIDSFLDVGSYGSSGELNITDGGLVSARWLFINPYSGSSNSNGGIRMSTGGMLALDGLADGSLAEFYGLIYGRDDIRYWDDSLNDWANLIDATRGVDYSLDFITTGNLAGYTVLTVQAVPEPGAAAVMGCLLAIYTMRRRGRRSLCKNRPVHTSRGRYV